jgi:hypothetical protein
MSSFERDADRLLALTGEGLSLVDACERLGIPYGTARKWIAAGHRTPSGKYGDFVARMETAQTIGSPRRRPTGTVLARSRRSSSGCSLAAISRARSHSSRPNAERLHVPLIDSHKPAEAPPPWH